MMRPKRTAKLLLIKHDLDNVTELAKQYTDSATRTTVNGNQAIVVFQEIESNPIWLLDLRRSGVCFLWLWGDEWEHLFQEVTTMKGKRSHYTRCTTTGDFNDLTAYLSKYSFPLDLVEASYDAAQSNGGTNSLLLTA